MEITISPITGSNYADTLTGSRADEVFSGRNGDDVIIGNNGHDEGWGGKGNDAISGNSGNDTLYGDASPSFATLNDLFITYDYPVSVTFQGEGAGYRNTFGWYKIDRETGQIKDVDVIWKNASQVGSGGNLVPGQTTESLEVSAGDQIGFFIVSNGYSINNAFFNSAASDGGTYEFRNADGSVASITDENPDLYHIAEDGTVTKVRTHDYHTTAFGDTLPLNSDGILHTVGQLDAQSGVLELGFEDLYNGGDLDFDDTVFSVDIGSANVEILNAHARYGASGYDIIDNEVVVKSDLESDFDFISSGAEENNHWDIRHMTMTNSDDDLIFLTSLYDTNGFNLLEDTGTVSLFLSPGSAPLPTANSGSAISLPERDGFLISIEMGSGNATVSISAVVAGIVGSSSLFPQSSLIIDDGMLRVQMSLSELGLSVGDQVSWIGYTTSEDGEHIALDIFDTSKIYEVASFNDTLSGNNGSDLIYGQKGADILYGGDGADSLNGGSGDDTIDGGSSDDTLYGNSGNDELLGGNRNDFLSGGSGADSLYGGDGSDRLEGNSGDDYLSGGSASDTLLASAGDDTLDGGTGDDEVFGGSGDDYLIADKGNDTLNGGSGTDTLSFENATSNVTANLGSKSASGMGEDVITSIENLLGSDFNDRLYGNHLDNLLVGGDGRDRLYGGNGNDIVRGGEGRDYLVGGSGEDTLQGDEGNDVLKGYYGTDYLSGGAGSDRFVYKSLAEMGDFISDFDVGGDQDQIDIASIFDSLGIEDTSSVLGSYLQYSDNGSGDTVVELDQTGSGASWDTIVVTLNDFDSQDLELSQFLLG